LRCLLPGNPAQQTRQDAEHDTTTGDTTMTEETAYQRQGREQRERQAARVAKLEAERKAQHKPRRKPARNATSFDRDTPFGQGDNLGESPDY
jgi:hypothetical protein